MGKYRPFNATKRYMHQNYTYTHIHIHNWPLQSFSQDYGLASHTTHVVCVNFIRERRDLEFNGDSERQIFEKLFHGSFIYSQSFCWEEVAEEIFFYIYILYIPCKLNKISLISITRRYFQGMEAGNCSRICLIFF